MAERGFWAHNFRMGAAEALAIEWTCRTSVRTDITAWLQEHSAEDIAKATQGSRKVRDIASAAVIGTHLVGRIITDLEECRGPLDHMIIAGLHISPMSNPHHPAHGLLWSVKLEEALAEELVQTEYFRKCIQTIAGLPAACNKFKTVQVVHEG